MDKGPASGTETHSHHIVPMKTVNTLQTGLNEEKLIVTV
jgi:hypothetical protein